MMVNLFLLKVGEKLFPKYSFLYVVSRENLLIPYITSLFFNLILKDHFWDPLGDQSSPLLI